MWTLVPGGDGPGTNVNTPSHTPPLFSLHSLFFFCFFSFSSHLHLISSQLNLSQTSTVYISYKFHGKKRRKKFTFNTFKKFTSHRFTNKFHISYNNQQEKERERGSNSQQRPADQALLTRRPSACRCPRPPGGQAVAAPTGQALPRPRPSWRRPRFPSVGPHNRPRRRPPRPPVHHRRLRRWPLGPPGPPLRPLCVVLPL
jgi:hypothetical protein